MANKVMIDTSQGRKSDEQLEAELQEMMDSLKAQEESRGEFEVPEDVLSDDQDDDDESGENFAGTDASEQDHQEDNKPKNEQNHNWRKRYEDARRREEDLRRKLKEAESKASGEGPVDLGLTGNASVEDLKDYVKQFPDFMEVIKAFVGLEVKDLREQAESAKRRATFEEVMAKVAKNIPNVRDIQKSQDLKDWLEDSNTEPMYVDALKGANMHPGNITRALKAFMEAYPEYNSTAPEQKKSNRTPITEEVSDGRGGKTAPKNAGKRLRYGTAMMEQVQKQLGYNGYIEWLDKHQDAIDKARRNGTFDYGQPTE